MNDENLVEHQFPPGQSGNPAGMEPGAKHGVRACLNRILKNQTTPNLLEALKKLNISVEDNDNAEALAQILVDAAGKGESWAHKLILEQTESPMPKKLELEGGPMQTVVNYHIKDPKEEK